jgi:hypothetical protein
MLALQFGALQNAFQRIEDVTSVWRRTEDMAILVNKVPDISLVLESGKTA